MGNSEKRPKRKILFLYSEIAAYFLACLRELSGQAAAEIHLVRWKVNEEAPFRFTIPGSIKVYERDNYSQKDLAALAEKITPDLIYCAGWLDKGYLDVCKKFRKKIPIIVGFDNKWTGSFKQQLGAVFSKHTIHRYFSHCWVPGTPQMEFGHRLGFKDENILKGLYSADFDFFNEQYLENREVKKKKFPHRFIFVGRYYDFKGVHDLWNAFAELHREAKNDWELWCFGKGDVEPMEHPSIRHFGFIQPDEMKKYVAGTGVFVLPSHFEPWAVAVHEFAAAGFPLICSDRVGAASTFLRLGENGYMFPSGDVDALTEVMKTVIALPDQKLNAMGERSAELAEQITPKTWTQAIMSIVK